MPNISRECFLKVIFRYEKLDLWLAQYGRPGLIPPAAENVTNLFRIDVEIYTPIQFIQKQDYLIFVSSCVWH